MKIKNLANNQVVIISDNSKAFFSYNTKIAEYINEQLYLNLHYWNYSKTTLKYLKEFMNTYTPISYNTKKQVEDLIASKYIKLAILTN